MYGNVFQEATYGGPPTLRDVLWQHFGWELGLPHLQEYDLRLLDKAIMTLNPPEALVRVVEADTFMARTNKQNNDNFVRFMMLFCFCYVVADGVE